MLSITERAHVVKFFCKTNDYEVTKKLFKSQFPQAVQPSLLDITKLVNQFTSSGSILNSTECTNKRCLNHSNGCNSDNSSIFSSITPAGSPTFTNASLRSPTRGLASPDVHPSPLRLSNILSPKNARKAVRSATSSKSPDKTATKSGICEFCKKVIKNQECSLQCCVTDCNTSYHLECIGVYCNKTELKEFCVKFKCVKCQKKSGSCCICKGNQEPLISCMYADCTENFHKNCLVATNTHSLFATLNKVNECPRHVCKTCASRSNNYQDYYLSKAPNFTHCQLCMTTYHKDMNCLPAGTEQVLDSMNKSGHHCISHAKRTISKELHITWCLICKEAGDLVQCKECPASFHITCLKICTVDMNNYKCDDCYNHRYSLYGEVIWVKVSKTRWWPCQILYPHDIPKHFKKVPRLRFQYGIHYLGSTTYKWLNPGRGFPFQDGDLQTPFVQNNNNNLRYKLALQEAKEIHELRQKDLEKFTSRQSWRFKISRAYTAYAKQNVIDHKYAKTNKIKTSNKTNIDNDSEDSGDGLCCQYCNEEWYRSKNYEKWIQCCNCHKWDHELCSQIEIGSSFYKCDQCIKGQK